MKKDGIDLDNIVVEREKILGNNARIDISGVLVDVLTMSETIKLVEKYIVTKTPLHLMGVNADKINSANENPKLKEIINSCGIINADGSSVVLASKYLDTPVPERVAGIDLMENLIKLASRKGYKIYLLGATQEVLDLTRENLCKKNRHLKIAGTKNGYFDNDKWPSIARELKKVKADIVFVGITSPKKEYLIEYLQNAGVQSVMMGVGGSFDVISGKIPRAPRWMQQHSLEWLFRVMNEPKRLFKRYFYGNRKFMRNIKQLKKKQKKSKQKNCE